MKLYLCYIENQPIVAYTSRDIIVGYYKGIIEIDCECNDLNIIVVCDKKSFINRLDAIIYAEKNDINCVYLCKVIRNTDDEFEDPDVIDLSLLFRSPLQYVAGLDVSYQIYNGLDPIESFKEAINMFNMCVSSDLVLINELINYDPYMKILLQQNQKEFVILATHTFIIMSDLIEYCKKNLKV